MTSRSWLLLPKLILDEDEDNFPIDIDEVDLKDEFLDRFEGTKEWLGERGGFIEQLSDSSP